jgi:hypothetical protein
MKPTARFRLTCRLLAALFLLIGALQIPAAFVPLADPLLSGARFSCDPCRLDKDPVFLLEPEGKRREAWRTPGMANRIAAQAGQRRTRWMLFAAAAVRAVPFFIMFAALAAALRSLAASGFRPAAVRWLRRSAAGALAWTLAAPVAESIRWTAFAPVTGSAEVVHVVFSAGELLLGVLIAGAVWISMRALEGALALQRDLEDYV